MSEIFREDDFYKDEGWPTEKFRYCNYKFLKGEDPEWGEDYDQFVLVENAQYPYIRLTEKRGRLHSPCGRKPVVAQDGHFAQKSDEEREKECPKIAWGFAAVFISELRYDNQQKDYVPLKDKEELMQSYYNKYLQMYFQGHNGLKYQYITDERKELNFLEEHVSVIKALWEKSEPLKNYSDLYCYAKEAETEYERFLEERRKLIMKKTEGMEEIEEKGVRRIFQNGEKSVYVEKNEGIIIIGSDVPNSN